MVNRYLKINPEEADSIKKQFAFSRGGLDRIVAVIRAYKLLRKKEIVIKNKLKISISSLKSKINAMESSFPEEERRIAFEKHYEQERKNIKPKEKHKTNLHYQEADRNVDRELEDIKTKLASFS